MTDSNNVRPQSDKKYVDVVVDGRAVRIEARPGVKDMLALRERYSKTKSHSVRTQQPKTTQGSSLNYRLSW